MLNMKYLGEKPLCMECLCSSGCPVGNKRLTSAPSGQLFSHSATTEKHDEVIYFLRDVFSRYKSSSIALPIAHNTGCRFS